VASLSQGRTAAAQCGLFTHKSVPVIFEPPCICLLLLTLPRKRGWYCLFIVEGWRFCLESHKVMKFFSLFHVLNSCKKKLLWTNWLLTNLSRNGMKRSGLHTLLVECSCTKGVMNSFMFRSF